MAVTPVSRSLHGLSHAEVVKCSYTWTIENFSFCTEKTGEFLVSPTFSIKTNDNKVLKCSIYLYPKGYSSNYSEYISLYLHLDPCDYDKVSAKYEFSLLNIKGNKEKTAGNQTAGKILRGPLYRLHNFFTLQYLLDKVNDLLPEDKLTIRCEVAVNMERINISQDDEAFAVKAPTRCVSELSDDLCKIFEDMTLSDVTLVVDEKEIQAHKVILAARSSVFAAMFQHQMKEQKSNYVHITDINHEVLTEMLQFMYTDRAPNLDNMAGDLLAAADKYALDSLKVVCGEALYKSISVETAAETLVLADLHSAEWLKARTIAFINTVHATEVMATAAWHSMITAHPQLFAEVYQALVIQQQQHLPQHNLSK